MFKGVIRADEWKEKNNHYEKINRKVFIANLTERFKKKKKKHNIILDAIGAQPIIDDPLAFSK